METPGSEPRAVHADPTLRLVPIGDRDADFCLWLPPFWFRLVWIVVALIYVACIGCFGVECWVYRLIPRFSLSSCLELYDVAMPMSDYRPDSLCFGAVAIIHGLSLLEMLVTPTRHRELTFGSSLDKPGRAKDRFPRCNRIFNLVLSERGLLGVKGRYFELIHIIREVVETVLQSVQAYRMSQLVSRQAVNHFFVLTIVIN